MPQGGYRPAQIQRMPERQGRSWFTSILLWGGLGVGALAVIAFTVLTIWSPADLVRDQLVARVKAQTGRDLTIAGPTSLSFFPSVAISMRDVTLSAPPGMAGAPVATMQALEASVPLMPLLQKQVSVERLILRKPVIDLRVDANGRRSWDFAALEAPRRIQLAQAGAGRPGQIPRELQEFVKSANPDSREAVVSKGPLAALETLSLEDIRIEGGTIRYGDERSGLSEEIQSLDAQLSLSSIASPLDAKGSLVWRGEPISFETRLASPKLLSEERAARLTLKVNGRPADIDYDGSVTLGRTPEADGTIALKASSLKVLLGLAGVTLPDAGNINTAALNGRLKASETSVGLSDLTFTLDSMTAQGALVVEPRGARPMIRGNLQIAELDLNRFALPSAGASAGAAAPPAAKARAVPSQKIAPAAKPAQSIEDLLRVNPEPPQGAARVQGYTRRAGWSDEPFDLSGFRLFDADLKLALGRLIYRGMKVGQTQMRVGLKDRALTVNFDDVQLYEGRGRGLLTVDGAAAVPAIGANMALDGTSAAALLKDAAEFEWLSGAAKINFAVAGQGLTEHQVMSSLQGKADVNLKDGAVVGYNVTNMLRGLSQGRFTGLERSPTEKTDFSEMAASFTIQNGVAQNKDLRLISPQLRITGAGSAHLGDRTMDYMLRPKLVSQGAGEGTGLEIPVKLTGSWDRPTIAPDIDGVLKNPDQAVDTIKQLGKQFKENNPEAMNKAKDLLNQFLKR
jgi:AsmA protein